MLTEDQLNAVRWYTGDVEGDDPFWGDPKAYVGVNALFFPGIGTETLRAAEGKRLNPALLADEERLRETLRVLLSAFTPAARELQTSRVERLSDYEAMKAAGHTLSFTSTSENGFLAAYSDRRGIALLRFRIPAGTPVIRMADALPYYAKSEEAEVLLPPGLSLMLTECPVPEAFLHIRDADGAPPQCYVQAVPGKLLSQPPTQATDGAAAGMRVFAALNSGEAPDPADVEIYSSWKSSMTASLLHAL